MMQTLGIEHSAVGWIVIVHAGKSLRETTLNRPDRDPDVT